MKNKGKFVGVPIRYETIRLSEHEVLVIRREAVVVGGIRVSPFEVTEEQDIDKVETYVLMDDLAKGRVVRHAEFQTFNTE